MTDAFNLSAERRFYYRDRAHQQAQHAAAVAAAGDLRGKSIVDVGCGYGDLIAHLPADCTYLGIDRAEWAVEEARRLHPGYEFRRGKWCPPADVVFSIATLQQSPHPERYLRRWFDAAREILVVTTVQDWKLSWADRGVNPWADVPEPEIPLRVDDWYVAVLRK